MLVEDEGKGKTVTREGIKSRLWANDTVLDFDQSINATIKALRRALGDSADNPQYIETLGRRGYRLMPTIECLESAPGTEARKMPTLIFLSIDKPRPSTSSSRIWVTKLEDDCTSVGR
jgi:DNA-binding winged helix-turn-helix (wHTH) protein